MPAISPMKKRLYVWRVKVAVLCVSFGFWSFIPLTGAEMVKTCCGPGESMGRATTATQEAADDVVMVMAAGAVLPKTVTPEVGALAITDANAVDAVAPLSGVMVAREDDRRPSRPQRPNPPPRPRPPPKPSPVR